jgi:tetratricopeptide (TPR) repeat protein
MFRPCSFPLFAFAALILSAAGCVRSDRDQTTSASEGANTPVVSGTSSGTDTGSGAPDRAVPVTYERAESTYHSGNFAEATQLFSSYSGDRPDDAWGHYMLGMSAWKSGDLDRALDAFDRSIELDPSHSKSLFNSSRVLLEQGEGKDAIERIEKALAQDSASNEGLRLLARAHYQLGQVDQAIAAYQKALAIDGRDVWSMNNLGLIYIEQDRSRDALPPLARAVQLRSNAPVFQNNLGVALERSGYPEAAAKAFEAALKADSTYSKAAVALARVTDGSQQPETEPVDLEALALRFQSEIDGWRDSVVPSDSNSTSVQQEGGDTTDVTVEPVSDSTASIQAHSETSEPCVH